MDHRMTAKRTWGAMEESYSSSSSTFKVRVFVYRDIIVFANKETNNALRIYVQTSLMSWLVASLEIL
jgi:hypothetical protein